MTGKTDDPCMANALFRGDLDHGSSMVHRILFSVTHPHSTPSPAQGIAQFSEYPLTQTLTSNPDCPLWHGLGGATVSGGFHHPPYSGK